MEQATGLGAAARSTVYRFLARAFADPDGETLPGMKNELPAAEAALAALGDGDSLAAVDSLRRALASLGEGGLAEDHLRVFGHTGSGDCPPYEGEYGHSHIFQKTQALADNAGFLSAFGLESAPGLHERADHVSVELEFMHFLAVKEAYALARGHGEERLRIVEEAERKYLERHLGRWTPAFAALLEAKAGGGVYAALARLLAAFLAGEVRALGADPPAPSAVSLAPAPEEVPGACEACPMASSSNPDQRGAP